MENYRLNYSLIKFVLLLVAIGLYVWPGPDFLVPVAFFIFSLSMWAHVMDLIRDD